MSEATDCFNCGDSPIRAKGRCRTCDAYWRRTKRERPDKLIERDGKRTFERYMERQLFAQALRVARGA